MKYYSIIFMILFSLSGKSQVKGKSFTINGHFKNLANSMVFLNYAPYGKAKVDSVKADASGNFFFRGKVSEPQAVYLLLQKPHSIQKFFLENTMYFLQGDIRNLKATRITGGSEQTVYSQYERLLDEVHFFMGNMQKPIFYNLNRKDTSGFSSFVHASTILWRDSLANRQVEFVASHASSSVSLYVMKYLTASHKPVSTLDSLMKLIERTPMAASPTAIEIRKSISSRLLTALGARAPEFSQPDTTGKLIAISELRGKYVLLDFWASWCAPCRKENPNVLNVYNRFKDHNFTVLAVSVDVKRNDWLKAVKEDKLPWMQVSDLKAKNEASRLYGVVGIPMNFLIDPKGNIIGVNLRGEELSNAVEKAVRSKKL